MNDPQSEDGFSVYNKQTFSRMSNKSRERKSKPRVKKPRISNSRLDRDFGTINSGDLVPNKEKLMKSLSSNKKSQGLVSNIGKNPLKERRLTKNEQSQSMANLLNTGNKISLKGKNTPRKKVAKITPIQEEPVDVEERMKNLPHWKYAASFNTYIKDVQGISDVEKQEFISLVKKKEYKRMYDFL